MPNIFIASDHAGFSLKSELSSYIQTLGYTVEDLGAHAFEGEDDYPDVVIPLAERVASEPGTFGIVIGGSGQGEAMCANRVHGARTAVFYGPMTSVQAVDSEGALAQDAFDIVRLPRKHNNANVLSIGARFVSIADAQEAVRVFLGTEFSGLPRHVRRIAKF